MYLHQHRRMQSQTLHILTSLGAFSGALSSRHRLASPAQYKMQEAQSWGSRSAKDLLASERSSDLILSLSELLLDILLGSGCERTEICTVISVKALVMKAETGNQNDGSQLT